MVKHEGGDPEGGHLLCSAGTVVLSSPGMFIKCEVSDSLCCCSLAHRTEPSRFKRMEHEQPPATRSDHPGGRSGQGRGDGQGCPGRKVCWLSCWWDRGDAKARSSRNLWRGFPDCRCLGQYSHKAELYRKNETLTPLFPHESAMGRHPVPHTLPCINWW